MKVQVGIGLDGVCIQIIYLIFRKKSLTISFWYRVATV